MDETSAHAVRRALARLASDGGAVIIGKMAAPVEIAAATDMAEMLGRILGRSIEVIDDTAGWAAHPSLSFAIGTPNTHRIIGEAVRRGMIRLPDGDGERGSVRVVVRNGKVLLCFTGADPAGSAHAAYGFLEDQCGVGFFPEWTTVPQEFGAVQSPALEIDPTTLERDLAPRCRYRIYAVHPWWTEPYAESCRLWGIGKWRSLIDWMRRKRLNGLLAFHDEGGYLWGDAIFRAFPEVAGSDENLKGFAMLPEYRTELNRKIFEYARASGIHIVYNLSYGQVPQFVRKAFPDLTYHDESMDSLTICASQPECFTLTERFWSQILSTYGIDDEHLYVICPYLHERLLCPAFASRAEPARQACELLRRLDPQARVFIENWDWPWGDWQGIERAGNEWRSLLAATPEDVGVLDLDRRFNLKEGGPETFGWYRPRPWMQLALPTLEAAYPPSGVMLSPEDLAYVTDTALDHGAAGIALFNIMARGNELLSTLFADLPWAEASDPGIIVDRYLLHRFGAAAAREAHFQKALESFRLVKELYRGLPEYSMAALLTLEPDVRYTPFFLQHWRDYEEKASQWKDMIWRFHVVWERFGEYEAFLSRLRP